MASTPDTKAVLFDFYGTLGESEWEGWWLAEVLAERGYELSADADRRWSTNALDGDEHREHSASEAAYLRWVRDRRRSLLADCGVADHHVEELLDAIDAKLASFRIRLYPETLGVLGTLRARGLRLAICSNWDWDLDAHLEGTGVADLIDGRVSSAWVGARKPHPSIFEATLAEVGAAPEEAVFVGDNWVADVEGPRAVGIRAVHVWRHDELPEWLPEPPTVPDGVHRITDLRPLPDLI